ncbi:diacylglycerol/lipid kinase family protein [Silvibacterium sp.]|uniref:diacylglycerol/lipid kinase family protein n=1 Tax=Silvibacterium sp. TaxID=1964179 RepID=UPI0039E2A7E4
MRRVLFFLNPLLMQRRNRRALVEGLARQLRGEGCEVELQDTLSAHSAGEQAKDAVAAGFDTLFVCGGDGTLFQVIQGVAGSEATVGIIPFGTGNVLAQNLRLPRDPVAAFSLLRRAEAVPVPLGRISCKSPGHAQDRTWYFTIAAGMGVHAALMNLAPTGSGKRVGGRAAYFAGGFRLLLQHPVDPFDLELTLIDGSRRTLQASELIAVRVPAINVWRPGGNLEAPELQVAIVPATTRLGLAHASFHALLTGRSANGTNGSSRLPYPEYVTATQIACRPVQDHTYQSPLLVEADGEVIGLKRASITIAQRRLRLLWPR